MSTSHGAVRGMPLYRFFGNRDLTYAQNQMLGSASGVERNLRS